MEDILVNLKVYFRDHRGCLFKEETKATIINSKHSIEGCLLLLSTGEFLVKKAYNLKLTNNSLKILKQRLDKCSHIKNFNSKSLPRFANMDLND